LTAQEKSIVNFTTDKVPKRDTDRYPFSLHSVLSMQAHPAVRIVGKRLLSLPAINSEYEKGG